VFSLMRNLGLTYLLFVYTMIKYTELLSFYPTKKKYTESKLI